MDDVLSPMFVATMRSCHSQKMAEGLRERHGCATPASYDTDGFIEFCRIHTAAGTPCVFCGREPSPRRPVQPIHIVSPRLGGNEAHHNLLPSCYRCYTQAIAITERLFAEWVARGGYAAGMPEENPMILEALERAAVHR